VWLPQYVQPSDTSRWYLGVREFSLLGNAWATGDDTRSITFGSQRWDANLVRGTSRAGRSLSGSVTSGAQIWTDRLWDAAQLRRTLPQQIGGVNAHQLAGSFR
jgi:hypothetical protein